jgi:hypothetical protein
MNALTNSPFRKPLIATTLVLAVSAGVAVASGLGQTSRPPRASYASHRTPATPEVLASAVYAAGHAPRRSSRSGRRMLRTVEAHYSLFSDRSVRSNRQRSTEVALAGWLPPPTVVARFGLVVSSEVTFSPSSGLTVSVLPGTSGGCMAWSVANDEVDGTTTKCSIDVPAFLQRGLMDVIPSPLLGTQPMVLALVPNGTQSVTLSDAAGSLTQAPVSNNLVLLSSPGAGPTTLTLHGAASAATYPVPR